MSQSTLPLTDFLLARIAEDEAAASAGLLTDCQRAYLWEAFEDAKVAGAVSQLLVGTYDPARVLAECEAKRRIVARSRWVEEHPEWGNDMELCGQWDDARATLLDLASIYADHADYRDDWRP